MTFFPRHVRESFPDDFILMVYDGAARPATAHPITHKSKFPNKINIVYIKTKIDFIGFYRLFWVRLWLQPRRA